MLTIFLPEENQVSRLTEIDNHTENLVIWCDHTIENDAMEVFADWLTKTDAKINKLCIRANICNLSILANVLKHPNNKLEELDVSFCDLQGMIDLAETLGHPNNRLNSLGLIVPDKGMTELVKALKYPACKILTLELESVLPFTKEDAEVFEQYPKAIQAYQARNL